MANQRSKVYNAFQTTLAAEMASSASSCQVVTVGPLTALTYLCIEPDSPTKREYVLIGGVSAPNLTGISRYLSGSAAGSGITHPSGSVVRSVPLQQMWEDLHDRVEFGRDHGNLTGLSDDDHNNYLNNARHDVLARHVPGVAIPVDIAGASAVGDTASIGTALTVSRSDHRHAREGFGAPVASAPGDSSSNGVALTVARSDHRHAREAVVSSSVVGVRLRRSVSIATTSGVLAEVPWDLEDYDTNAFHAPGLGTIVIPIAGKYLICAQLDTSTTGLQFFTVQVNGVAVASAAVAGTDLGASAFTIPVSTVVALSVSDVVRVMYQQTTGGSRSIWGGVGSFFEANRLGA